MHYLSHHYDFFEVFEAQVMYLKHLQIFFLYFNIHCAWQKNEKSLKNERILKLTKKFTKMQYHMLLTFGFIQKIFSNYCKIKI